MNLRMKFNLILLVVFALGFVPFWLIGQRLVLENARAHVVQNARLMMETAMATRAYTIEQIRPLLDPMLGETFLPQSVPAYSATTIFESLRKKYPEYTYKEASINPTNPKNRTVDWEADLVSIFKNSPETPEIVGERPTPLGRTLYLAHPITVSNQGCLACHDRPDNAPQSMLRLYGSSSGFGWKVGEVIGAQIVSIPLTVPLEMAGQQFRTLVLVLLGIFIFVLVTMNVLLHYIVIRPMRQLAAAADAVSLGNFDVPEMHVSGKDEVAGLAGAFQRMRISMQKALRMLEEDAR